MTDLEKRIAKALLQCSYQPASFEKKFVLQLPNWYNRPMTDKGRYTLVKLFWRYRRQIAKIDNWHEINMQINPDEYYLQWDLFDNAVIKTGRKI